MDGIRNSVPYHWDVLWHLAIHERCWLSSEFISCIIPLTDAILIHIIFGYFFNQYFFKLSVFNVDEASCVIGKKISALNPWKISGLSYNEGLSVGFATSVSVVLTDLSQNINKIFYLIFFFFQHDKSIRSVKSDMQQW